MKMPDSDILERITDAHWNGEDMHGVHFTDQYMHDAINYTLSGTIDVDGELYGFIIDDGNWNGTQVIEWGLADDVGIYKPPVKESLTFIPIRPHSLTENMLKVYLSWKETEWFKKKAGEMNYDLHFCPSLKIRNYYEDWANSKGMEIGLFSSVENYFK